MVNLSELPEDIIGQIVKRLPSLEDTVRFGAVCRSWNCLVNHAKVSRKCFGPWLMLTKLDNDDLKSKPGKVRSCYSLSSTKLFNVKLSLLRGRRCFGTPHGWLFTIGLDKRIFLFHPFTGATIFYPTQRRFKNKQCSYSGRQHICRNFITRVALSCNPSSHSSPVAMVIYGGGFQVAFASPGDKTWTHFKTHSTVKDIVFFKGNFYCFDAKGVLWICNIDHPHPTAQPIASAPTRHVPFIEGFRKYYLVEISERLYFIDRIGEYSDEGEVSKLDGRMETMRFVAFVFDFHTKQWLHNTVEDLNGHAVLLGNNTTCAVSTSDYPELRPDCIYFTDDQAYLYERECGYYYDMGVYDFKNKTMVEPFYEVHELSSQFSRPFFFFPSLA